MRVEEVGAGVSATRVGIQRELVFANKRIKPRATPQTTPVPGEDEAAGMSRARGLLLEGDIPRPTHVVARA